LSVRCNFVREIIPLLEARHILQESCLYRQTTTVSDLRNPPPSLFMREARRGARSRAPVALAPGLARVAVPVAQSLPS
jgi:hypothetical protein